MRHHNRPIIFRTRVAAITPPYLDLFPRSTTAAAYHDEREDKKPNDSSDDGADFSTAETIATVLGWDCDGTVRSCSRHHA
ncbi:unnamed protein product [Fusarium graminearum]|uniref:Chromosome 4, complete genome n=2 Tax=Gibberella zeae TaxID=5518 RepID=A0A098DPT2_GIBZE|nr:unnamed protein product [Fusarium graminearum]CAF3476658.1 unnamed protein product [Fusarium graminearum]CAF3637209.1 unnamed protein product [Fusarium graminearum]CAG1975091.1 unnamed protein product [Fusarium graminearum]CAG1978545.1 unnamed protein product [Fusarium graminearum]